MTPGLQQWNYRCSIASVSLLTAITSRPLIADRGLLADGIITNYPNINLECVELNQECKNVLKEKGYNVVGSDFFLFNPKYQYDFVIGAPNFRDNIDCKHVMKMYDLVKQGGTVSSIMSPYWMTGNSELQIEFRQWLNGKKYSIDMLPDNTFMENGMTVPTIITGWAFCWREGMDLLLPLVHGFLSTRAINLTLT